MTRRRPFLILAGALAFVVAAAAAWAAAGPPGGATPAAAVEQTVTVSWGPYALDGATAEGPGQIENEIDFDVEKPCTDCYITRAVPNLVYDDGSTVNFNTMGMLHHTVIINSSGTDATCGSTGIGGLGERVFASGNERTVLDLPAGYGYYVAPGDTWLALSHLMNMSPDPKTFYLEMEITYLTGDEDVKPVTPLWLDIDNCADSEVPFPAGYADVEWDWLSDREGYITFVAGHLHDYGIAISAENVEAGMYMCTSVAGYASGSSFAPAPVPDGDAGHPGAANVMDPGNGAYVGRIEDMSTCQPMFPVTNGDTLRLHAQYNHAAADPDDMGIMMAYMHETSLSLDYDGDGVADGSDSCPFWANPGQEAMPWSVPSGDADCDGFSMQDEGFVGTDPNGHCGAGAWPPDFSDDGTTDIFDVNIMKPALFSSPPGPPYDARLDLEPDGTVDIFDVNRLKPFFFLGCAP